MQTVKDVLSPCECLLNLGRRSWWGALTTLHSRWDRSCPVFPLCALMLNFKCLFFSFYLALCDNGCVSGRGGFHLLMPMIALNAPCEVGLKHQFEFGKVYFTRLNLPFVEGLDPCPAVSMCQHLERCRGHDARMGSGRARRITLVNDKHLVVIQLYFAPMWQQTLECPRTLESK